MKNLMLIILSTILITSCGVDKTRTIDQTQTIIQEQQLIEEDYNALYTEGTRKYPAVVTMEEDNDGKIDIVLKVYKSSRPVTIKVNEL